MKHVLCIFLVDVNMLSIVSSFFPVCHQSMPACFPIEASILFNATVLSFDANTIIASKTIFPCQSVTIVTMGLHSS